MPGENTTQRFKAAIVDRGSYTTVGSAVAAIIFLVAAAWNLAAWKAEKEHEIADLRKEIHALDSWHIDEMYTWCLRTEALNDGFRCAPVREGGR